MRAVYKSLKKRPMLLLEVLIAMALIILCALPLIAPHAEMVKEQRKFQQNLELHHASHLLFVHILELMHLNKISWNELHNNQAHPITEEMLKVSGYTKTLPFKGSYRFEEIKFKHNKSDTKSVHLMRLILTFNHQNKTLELPYTFTIARQINTHETEQGVVNEKT